MNQQPQPPAAILVNKQTGQTYPLSSGLVTIGRKSDNTVVLSDDLKVSRHHATIAWIRNRYVIHDVGSANGTFLNGQRLLEPKPLSNGDELRLSQTTFTVILSKDETKPSYKPSAEEQAIINGAMAAPAAPTPAPQPAATENPYVGPKTFTQEESNRFFGREREARELHSLVVAQRLVLFYAQSGAGKSSLINTRLAPQLRETGMPVLPIGRVSGELPQGIESVENIFIFNLLLSLNESDGDPRRFTNMPLSQFLTKLTSLDGIHYYYDDGDDTPTQESGEPIYGPSPYILIIDQFEEIVTTHPARWQDREDFFRQLAQAVLDDSYLWVVLTLREDYVAMLDPYAGLLPGNLRARFYMQRMDYGSALEAITKPAEQYGRPFAPGVAESLADNLRQIQVSGSQAQQPAKTQLGQYIEPVQLQVVCYQLWENLKGRPAGPITGQDLQESGNVNQALGQFYDRAVTDAVAQPGVSEIDVRNWFDHELITEAGTKGIVYRGRTHTAGIPNQVVEFLEKRFLLRREEKAGGAWYELVHDRFIEPILLANLRWREKQPLIQVARSWLEAGRPVGMLFEGDALAVAMASNWQGLGPLVREFLEASQAAQHAKEESQRADQEAQQRRDLEQAQEVARLERERAKERGNKLKILTLMSSLAVVLAFVAGGFGWQAFRQFQTAQENLALARLNEEQAIAAQQTAEANAELAITKEAEARTAQERTESESAAAAANAAEARNLLATQNALLTLVAETAVVGEEMASANRQATLDSINVTLTALAATPTPAPTETVTPTPAIPPTPAASGPTDTPTATVTATPDLGAIETADALKTAQAAVQGTQTAVPATQTAEAISCKFEPQGQFGIVWIRHFRLLGCPVQQTIGGQYAEQPFENGYMIWSGITEWFFVMVGQDSGPWYFIPKVDSYNPDGVACDVGSPPEKGLVQPVRGFGGIWCDRKDIRAQIGWGTAPEFSVVDNQLQEFEKGYLLRDSRGFTYVLPKDQDYIRVGN